MLRRGLIVSCQAHEDSPHHGPEHMTAMALAAEQGGAVALRANGPDDISAIKRATNLPVIGLWKLEVTGFDTYITPTLESARAVAEAGADLIALDATERPHPEGPLARFLRRVKSDLGLPVLADVSTLTEGLKAAKAGADYVATTLAGYTPYSSTLEGPDLGLLRDLSHALEGPVVAEGRFGTPEQVAEAFELGAHAVVVGTAITDPRELTRRFARAVPRRSA